VSDLSQKIQSCTELQRRDRSLVTNRAFTPTEFICSSPQKTFEKYSTDAVSYEKIGLIVLVRVSARL
jgi:hypothetical protein